MPFLVTKDKRSLLLWADKDTPTTPRHLEGFPLPALRFRWNNKNKLPFVFSFRDGAGAPHLLRDPQAAPPPMGALELLLGKWCQGLGQLQLLSDKHTETHTHSSSRDNTTMTDLLSCIITSATLKLINLWFMSFQRSCTKHSSTLTLPIPTYNNCSCPFQVSEGKKGVETEEKGRFLSHCEGLAAAQAEWSICCKHLLKAGRKWHFWHILPRWKP